MINLVNGSQEYGEDPVASLTGLHTAVICALGDHVGLGNVPHDAGTVLSRFPKASQVAFHIFAAGDFPGKEWARPEVALFEYLCGPYVEKYREDGQVKFMLNDIGLEHYHEIIGEDEERRDISEAQPADSDLARRVGGGTLAAVWAG